MNSRPSEDDTMRTWTPLRTTILEWKWKIGIGEYSLSISKQISGYVGKRASDGERDERLINDSY